MVDIDSLKFDEKGLLPGVVQTPGGEVLRVVFLNREAVQKTHEKGLVTSWCSVRQCLHTLGEGSGSPMKVWEMRASADQDALLLVVEPGAPSAFEGDPLAQPWIEHLELLLKGRKASASGEGSYTQKLFAKGVDRIGKKVVEEAGEVVIAAKNWAVDPSDKNREEYLGEAADLLFHLQVLLVEQGFGIQDIAAVLQERHRQRS